MSRPSDPVTTDTPICSRSGCKTLSAWEWSTLECLAPPSGHTPAERDADIHPWCIVRHQLALGLLDVGHALGATSTAHHHEPTRRIIMSPKRLPIRTVIAVPPGTDLRGPGFIQEDGQTIRKVPTLDEINEAYEKAKNNGEPEPYFVPIPLAPLVPYDDEKEE